MGLFDRFKRDPRNVPIWPEHPCTIPQRPVDPEVLEPALENPLLESAIAKLPKPKKKTKPLPPDPRLREQFYGRK